MKRLTLLFLLAVCMLATTGASQEVKKEEIKYEMDDLGKSFGIKFKAAKLQQGKIKGDTLITMTLEFTKEVPAVAGFARPLENMRNLFAGKKGTVSGLGDRDMALRCYFFDEDGVVFTKQPPGKIEGEVSGKEGDAFRISQSVPKAVLAKTKKISFRMEPAK